MRPERLTAIIDSTFRNIMALQSVKSGEYAKDNDKLANFREASNRLGILPEQVLMVYLDKHYSAICNFIQDRVRGVSRPRSEPIHGRVDDAILYLLLFKALLADSAGVASALAADPPTRLDFDE